MSQPRAQLDRHSLPHRSLLATCVALAVGLLLAACGPSAASPSAAPGGAGAQSGGTGAQSARKPTTVAEIAMYRGADREQVLLAGAQAEGKLSLYTSLTWMETVARDFEKKYPFVTVEFYRSDSKDLTERLTNEYKAGRYTTDIVHTTEAALELLREEGILQEFWTPELPNFVPEAMKKGPNGGVMYLGSGENHISLGFNTTLVPPAEAPRTLDDLLDPRWRGRMSIVTSTTGVQWVGMALETKGRDYVQRLAGQEIKLQNLSGAALAQLVVAGEVPLSPTIFDNNIAVAKERGAPVEWRPVEPVIATLQSATLATRAPHPHTAMLYLDFLHSRDGQDIMAKGGLDSPRLDMVTPEKSYQKLYLQSKYPLDEYEKHFAEWERLLKQLGGRS